MLSDGAQALNWRAGTVSAAGDRLRSAKQLEVAGEAGKQFVNWSEVGHPSAAWSHAALVTGPYAVQSQALVDVRKPLTCWCSELWCTQTVVPAAKGYLCCWGAGVTCRMGICRSKAEQGFLHVHSCFCKLGTGENAFSRERSWYIHWSQCSVGLFAKITYVHPS